MEEGRRRAYIKQQTASRKEETGTSNPSIKRKPSDKNNRPPKKPKVVVGPITVIPDEVKLPPWIGKGLMTGKGPGTEKRPVLLREDPQYALKQLLSILKDDDYEDLGNHSTKAMGEMGLFSLAQV